MFDNPGKLSKTGDGDSVRFKIKNLTIFKSAETGLTLTMNSIVGNSSSGGAPQVKVKIPP